MALLGKQKDLDKNKDGEISSEDFAMLREQRMSGGLLDDDMMRVGYADRGLVGPKEMEYPNFGFNEDYINKEIANGIITHSKHMAKYSEKYSNPEERENYINEHITEVAKNLKRAGNLNEETMRSEFEKQLSVYNLGQDKEREPMIFGGLAKAAANILSKAKNKTYKARDLTKEDVPQYNKLISNEDEKIFIDASEKYPEIFNSKDITNVVGKNPITLGQAKKELQELKNLYDRLQKKAGKDLNTRDLYDLKELESLIDSLELDIVKIQKSSIRKGMNKGGEMEMLPDEEMEQNFVDFVISEALSPEEKSMLEEQLEANPELSIMFDKVVETASEFTGAGPVEGPGTGTSDDIPARLSDGEFVFTAKAVEQIGADNLMQMMKDAEAAYDAGGEREAMQEGGMPSNTEKVEVEYTINRPADAAVSGVTPLLAEQEQEDMMDEEIKKSMLGLTPYVRS